MNPREDLEPGARVRHRILHHEGTVARRGTAVREVVHVLYDGHLSPVITAKRVLDRIDK